MTMDYPLLLLPRPTDAGPKNKGSGPTTLHLPSRQRQVERLAPAFEELGRAIASDVTSLRASAYATAPECVVVFETAGPVEGFVSAVRATGLDWLGEFDEDDIPPDDDFFDPADRTATMSGRVFLVMANQQAIDQLISLWKRYSADESAKFPHACATLKTVFKQLRAVRRWNTTDRLHETGVLKDWRESLALRHDVCRFEAELFFREDDIKRGKAVRAVQQAVEEHGGRIVHGTVVREICYHGLLIELPAAFAASMVDSYDRGQVEGIRLLQVEDVMFFRPGPQQIGITPLASDEAGTLDEPSHQPRQQPRPTGSPVLALLDGLPVANHPLLAGRIIIDDPDGMEKGYEVKHRNHGTAMASLMVHDELGAAQATLAKPLYVRPILRPDNRPGLDGRECMPPGVLPVDLIHRAVRRMVLGEGDGPAAPDVRVVGLSLGDESRQFDGTISPLARLLDWLSWKYKLLFVVSAGNHTGDIDLGVPNIRQMQPLEIEAAVLRAVASDVRHRKLLSPGESINALTVGAAHADHSTYRRMSGRIDPYSDKLPCPYSRVGLGHRRAIKPDVLLPGGRQLLIDPMTTRRNGTVVLKATKYTLQPGQEVATPGVASPSDAATCFTRGTSNATALAARHAVRICDMLANLRGAVNGDTLEDRFFPIIAKALLTHGARWGDTYPTMKRMLASDDSGEHLREQVTRFIGYGLADPERVMACTERRATLIGCGLLKDGQAKVFHVPLPDGLTGRREWRRLTVTLAWFSPVAPGYRNYRKAALWFNDPTDPMKLERQDADWQAVQRGTLQHEIFEGAAATAFAEDAALRVQVNCREDAGKLEEHVPFALAVTLEVAEGSAVPVYQQLRARIEPRIAVRAAI